MTEDFKMRVERTEGLKNKTIKKFYRSGQGGRGGYVSV